ncbi:MAG: methyltransferase domain-containing protein [Gammaproteobacteria bacterium]|nr:methyltransferase domain-containing protein [Gammaproteobacteria bacterium]NNF62279.1 methyltransferase domain-containing protein [Gammaproteobacteria bacterium]NNM20872.1 methyltransferase domain-containing protein [Gammaproteobacteria bacterium]
MLDARVDPGEIAGIYRRIAPVYNVWATLAESRARKLCLRLAAIRDGEAVLEVAVGTGLAFAGILAANPGGRNEGIDLTEAMLTRARRRANRNGNDNFRLSVGDARALEFPDCQFDVVINNYMFDLLPETDFLPVLTEFRRVLRPGGRLVISGMTTGKRWYNRLWERVYRLNPALLGGCRGVELLPYVQRTGFIDAQRSYISQMTFPSEIIHAVVPQQRIE